MLNFVQPGNVIPVTAPTGGVKSGDALVIGDLFGVAATDADAGAEVEMQVVGVFTLPKAAGQIAAGTKVYWDTGAGNVTTTADSNRPIGHCIEAAGGSATTCKVRLNGAVV